MVWSVVVVNLPNIGFTFDTNKLFWLAALPGLSGATLRIFYSFMVPIFGGRKWTAISTASLLIPAIGIGFAVRDPNTSYTTMLILALLCGFGGGNFASSMANISFFFPKAQKGTALGLNAGLGNLGCRAPCSFWCRWSSPPACSAPCAAIPQMCVVKGVTRPIWLQNAGFIWVPFILASTIAAWFGMNDIASAKASFKDQAIIFKRKHNWLMCWLYLGTFGSFIGYSAGLPLLTKSQFPGIEPDPVRLPRPAGRRPGPAGGWLGGRQARRRDGSPSGISSSWPERCFGVLFFLPHGGSGGNFWGFLAMFILLFFTTGIGNGSTFRMIPVIFLTERQRDAQGKGAEAQEQAIKDANKEAAAVLGFTSAFAAYGAFFIPKSFGTSIAATGGPDAALYGFIVFYAQLHRHDLVVLFTQECRDALLIQARCRQRSQTDKNNQGD